jgi:uncharacterized protein (DUF362 family)/NAD-dependent dihydropyrimidine dehydrogenase PreA subunit
MSHKVAVTGCSDYELDTVYNAIAESLELLGGIEAYVSSGDTVLLKPNVLAAWEPEKAVTTHPYVVEAVARLVQDAGGKVLIGESSGGSGYNKTAEALRRSGIADAAQRTSSELLDFDQLSSQTRYVQMIDREISFPSVIADVDMIISLPKLKTHSLTGITGAIKNMFGAIPGPKKAQMHREFPNKELFSKALVGIFATVHPKLSIMDGIVAMEGDGPAAGKPKSVGLVIASEDAVAMDTLVTEKIARIDVEYIDMLRFGGEAGLGSNDISQIEILGKTLDSDREKEGFRLPMTYAVYSKGWLPDRLKTAFMKMAYKAPVPRITRNCIGCGRCVESCPVEAIQLTRKGKNNRGRKAVIDLDKCISCFCCHEMCKDDGVNPYIPWIWRMSKI